MISLGYFFGYEVKATQKRKKASYSGSHWYGVHLKPRPVKFLAVESVPH